MAVTVEEALRAWLVADATIAGLVGGSQVYKESIPTTATIAAGTGAISYQVLGDASVKQLDGPAGDNKARIGLTLVCASEADLKALSQAIQGTRTARKLDMLGPAYLGDSTTKVWAQNVKVEDRPDDFVPSPFGADRGEFLSHMAVTISYWAP